MKTKNEICADFDGDKTEYNPKSFFRHGGLKIQAIKCRKEAHLDQIIFPDKVNCDLSIIIFWNSSFLLIHFLKFFLFYYHADFFTKKINIKIKQYKNRRLVFF